MTLLMRNFKGLPVRSKLLKSVILSPSFGRRTSRDVSDAFVLFWLFGQESWAKSRDAATKFETFREVLRPKEGLRMTDHGTGLRMRVFRVFRASIRAGILTSLFAVIPAFAQQDKFQGVVTQGVERVRIAVADFKPANSDPNTGPLLSTFNSVLFSDLQNAGIFDVVSKSFNPLQVPGSPQEVTLDAWANPPTNAAMLAFGNLGVSGGQVAVFGWLYDVKNTVSPQVLGKQYREDATQDNARVIAHRFADEIIFRLGGGIPGIAESKIVYVSNRTGTKEIWMMDYDGNGEHQVTKLGGVALSPRISPDSSRLAFVELGKRRVNIQMYSLELNRVVTFPAIGGTTISPAWSPDGTHLAFSSSRTGDPEIYVSNSSGGELTRLTEVHGPDVSPVFNPKTGGQIAFISGRSGLPQLYIMASDGTNVQRMTDTGYAVSPSWSPNGQYLVFAWSRRYGPGVPGAQDIYIMDVASKTWAQLTHDAGSNDFPSWSPDGRHIVFQSNRAGTTQ